MKLRTINGNNSNHLSPGWQIQMGHLSKHMKQNHYFISPERPHQIDT